MCPAAYLSLPTCQILFYRLIHFERQLKVSLTSFHHNTHKSIWTFLSANLSSFAAFSKKKQKYDAAPYPRHDRCAQVWSVASVSHKSGFSGTQSQPSIIMGNLKSPTPNMILFSEFRAPGNFLPLDNLGGNMLMVK